MHWIVMKDHISGEENPDAGACRVPRDRQDFRYVRTTPEFDAWVKTLPYQFRLYDDDGELYYEGRCGDLAGVDADQAFAPLDWAEYYAGCTTMKYRRGNGAWQFL